MKKFITNKFVLFSLGVLFLIAVWFIVSLLYDKNGGIFPSPILTFEKFFELLAESYTYVCLGYTLLRMLVGFTLAFTIAFVLGVITGNNPYLYQFLKPLMVALKSIPTVALVFLFIILVRPKDAPIFVVLLICFPILYEGVAGGIHNVDKQFIDAAKVDGANTIKGIWYIKLPMAIPYIIVSIVSSFALSFKIEIMAEVMTGYTKNGLGSAIQYAQKEDPSDMTTIFAYALFAVIIMLIVSLGEEVTKKLLKKNGKLDALNN